jgi:hypothetical protein
MTRVWPIALLLLCACAIGHVARNCDMFGVAIGHASVSCCPQPEPTAIANVSAPAWVVTPTPSLGPTPMCARIEGGTLSTGFVEMVDDAISGFLIWWKGPL